MDCKPSQRILTLIYFVKKKKQKKFKKIKIVQITKRNKLFAQQL